MKEILAVIRMNKINQTKASLVQAGYPSMTAVRVMGRGSKPVDYEVVKAASTQTDPIPEVLDRLTAPPRLIAKRMISLVVPDEAVPVVVKTIIEANSTGSAGDGKIFVLPVMDAMRVRTYETGDAAISEMAGNQGG
ncbi:P-II family nitrogen regulator [bacterium]|nr:MAG: P-II family nitrogen regulator [bacterium]